MSINNMCVLDWMWIKNTKALQMYYASFHFTNLNSLHVTAWSWQNVQEMCCISASTDPCIFDLARLLWPYRCVFTQIRAMYYCEMRNYRVLVRLSPTGSVSQWLWEQQPEDYKSRFKAPLLAAPTHALPYVKASYLTREAFLFFISPWEKCRRA